MLFNNMIYKKQFLIIDNKGLVYQKDKLSGTKW